MQHFLVIAKLESLKFEIILRVNLFLLLKNVA